MSLKNIKKILLVFLSLFLICNIVWAINFYNYYKFISGYEKSPISFVKSGQDYTYTIACPSYMNLAGNFALTNNDNLSIIIWPNLFACGASEYGVGIYDEKSDSTYRFYVDKELKYLNIDDNEEKDTEKQIIKSLLKTYQQELFEMRQLIKKEWQQ